MIGYSLNDTIVIFDRIRENFRMLRKAELLENINISTTQTLLRTMATSVSTLLAVGALMVFGGENLWGFSLALLIGAWVGILGAIRRYSLFDALATVGAFIYNLCADLVGGIEVTLSDRD